MRYELDVNGYVLAVFWGCNSGNCAEYTGEVPYGYTDLNDWSENALINAYYIDNSGNLVLDSDRKAKLEEKAIQEAIDYTPLFAKDLYGSNAILDSQYQKQIATGTILNLENVKSINPKVKITNIDYMEYSSINLYSHSRNMLKNDGNTETINGVSFTGLADGSIKINGTATANIEYNLSGNSENTIPIFVLKNNTNHYLNIGGYSCEMKYHDGETTAQVYTGASGLINLSEDKEVTQVLLKIPKGTTINNKIIFPMLNYGTKAEPYEEYKCKVLNIDFGEPFSSDALYPDDELYPSDDLFPSGELLVTDYILIENGAVYVSKNNEVRILCAGNVQVFDGNNTLYADKDVNIEIQYSIDALKIEKDFDTKLTKTKEELRLEASGIYATQDSLKDYSTTTEMNAAISVKANEINSIVEERIVDVTNTVSEIKTLTLEECIAGSLLELHIYGNNEVFNGDSLIKTHTRNICPTQSKDWEQGSFNGTTGEKIDSNNRLRLVDMLKVDNKQITLSVEDDNYCLKYVYWYDKDKNYISGTMDTEGKKSVTLNLSDKTQYINPTLIKTDNTEIDPTEIVKIKPQIEYGNEKTEFIEHNTQSLELGVTEVLRQNSDVQDEYILSNGQAQVIRRINKDGTIKGTPTTENLGKYNISLVEGTNIIEIQNYTANMKAKYTIKNTYTDTFATKSVIHQTAEEINIEVRKKVDGNEIISSINQSAEQVTIQADKININGTVSANGNFKVSTEGNMECTDATINGGNVTINDSSSSYDTAKFKVNGSNARGYMSSIALELYNNDLSRGVALAIDGIQGGNQIYADSESGSTGIGFGEIWTSGNIYGANISSDRRLKENIAESNIDAIEIIKKIGIKSFDWKDSKKHINAGYIAQDMEEIDDNFVLKKPVLDKEGQVIDYKYYINELPIVATLTKAMQEQQEIIEDLQKQIKELKEVKQ